MSTSVQPVPADAFADYDKKYGAPKPAQAADPFAAYDQKYAKPGVGAQIKSGLSDVGHAFMHPISTLETMGKSVASDVGRGFFTPVTGTENIPSAKSGQLPRPNMPVGATVTAENTPGAISPHEAEAGALRSGLTAGLFAAPEFALPGRLALNAGAGAVYNPEQPIRGAVAGAVLGEAVHGALKGPGAAARALDVSQGAVEHAMSDYANATRGTSPTEVTDRSIPAPGTAAALAMERGKLPSADRPTPTIVEPGPAPKPKGRQPAPSLIQPATDYLGGGRTIDKNPLVTAPDEPATAPSALVDAQGNPLTTTPKGRPRAGTRVPLPEGHNTFDAYDAKYGVAPEVNAGAAPELHPAFAAFDAKYPEAAPADAARLGAATSDVQSGLVDQHGQPLAPNEAQALLLGHAGSERAGETLGEAGPGQGGPANVGESQAAGGGPGEPPGPVAPGPGAGQTLPGTPAPEAPLLNERTLNVSAAAQSVFDAAKARLASEGFQKERVSMGAQRASAGEFASQLGISPLDLDPKKVGRMSGPEIERVKELAGQHMDMIAQLSKELADPSIEPQRAAELNSMLDEARDQNHAALQTIVRGSAQIGRDLGYLRQVAQHSLDPDVWVVQAQRLAGDARLSDETIADIRRMAKEAADACAGGVA